MVNKRLKEKMKRRRNGEGSVSERKDGYFQASLMVRGERGYEYASTEKAAYEKLEKMRDKARRGISDWWQCYTQYLMTTLYNAPSTINNYYTAEVNHDLYGTE